MKCKRNFGLKLLMSFYGRYTGHPVLAGTLQLKTGVEDFVETGFYCPHALDGNN